MTGPDVWTILVKWFIAYNNYLGIRLGLFTPDQAFDVVARKQIEKLRKPCLNIIQLVATELYNVAKNGVMKVVCQVKYEVFVSNILVFYGPVR